MRKTSYAVTFLLVLVSLTLVSPRYSLRVVSITIYYPLQEHPRYHSHRLVSYPLFESDPPSKALDFRLVDPGREFLYTRINVRYGLMKRCERQVVRIPDSDGDWQFVYTAFKCRDFPKSVSDRCEKENRLFCVEWTSAGYLAQLAVGFGTMALFALLIGVSTHSRRRRVWKAVAGLVTLNGAWPIFAGTLLLVNLLEPFLHYSPLFHVRVHHRD